MLVMKNHCFRCFLSQESRAGGGGGGGGGGVVKYRTAATSCDRQLDTKTEIILAASISVLVLLILSW